LKCHELCPPSHPFRCGNVCAETEEGCTVEILALTQYSFGVIFGLGTLTASILSVVGVVALNAAIAGLGIVIGTLSAGGNVVNLIQELISVPFCTPEEQTKVLTEEFRANNAKYKDLLESTICKASNLNPQ
jgi:hypothetical protein